MSSNINNDRKNGYKITVVILSIMLVTALSLALAFSVALQNTARDRDSYLHKLTEQVINTTALSSQVNKQEFELKQFKDAFYAYSNPVYQDYTFPVIQNPLSCNITSIVSSYQDSDEIKQCRLAYPDDMVLVGGGSNNTSYVLLMYRDTTANWNTAMFNRDIFGHQGYRFLYHGSFYSDKDRDIVEYDVLAFKSDIPNWFKPVVETFNPPVETYKSSIVTGKFKLYEDPQSCNLRNVWTMYSGTGDKDTSIGKCLDQYGDNVILHNGNYTLIMYRFMSVSDEAKNEIDYYNSQGYSLIVSGEVHDNSRQWVQIAYQLLGKENPLAEVGKN